MLTHEQKLAKLKETIAKFPATFGLRQWSGTFRISPGYSYINDNDEQMLYTEILKDGEWVSFAKGTEAELRREIVIHG